MNIYKIALTGGPCAGKTSVIKEVTKLLEESGYYVITIPETATTLIKNKFQPLGSRNHILNFQELVLKSQTTKEEIAQMYCQSMIDNNESLIKDKKGIIILCDRGIMDNRAYLSHIDYHTLLKKHNYNELKLLETYDYVIDLISLATTNPELYALDGIRYETQEIAATIDQITSAAWLMHKNISFIKPTNTIEEKINIVFSNIINFLEGKQKDTSISLEVDKEKTDFTPFNVNNSRKIKITSFSINFPNNQKYILDKKQSEENTLFIVKNIDSKTNNPKPFTIDYKTYTELSNLNLLSQLEQKEILYFINNGNYFNIIDNYNIMTLHTDKDNIYNIPSNIVLKKTLTK